MFAAGLAVLLLLPRYAVSDPAVLPFHDCFSNSNTSQKLTINRVYGQLTNDGSILDLTVLGNTASGPIEGSSNGSTNLATLFTSTTVLTLGVFTNSSYLCQTMRSPAGSECPIAPGEFSFSSHIPWGYSRSLTTLNTRLRAVDPFSQELLCLEVSTTPLDPDDNTRRTILFSTVALTLAYLVLVSMARIASAWNRGNMRPGIAIWHRAQSAGYILASAISGERFSSSPALVRFCTPSFRDLVFHAQWCTILAMIAVQWPHFVYPILTQTAWATLSYNISVISNTPRYSPLSTLPFLPSTSFASQLSDPNSAIYIDRNVPNMIFTLPPPEQSPPGLASWAYTIGLHPHSIFPICLVIFLGIAAAICAISITVACLDKIVCYIAGLVPSHNGPPVSASKDILHQFDTTERPPSRLTLTGAVKAKGWWSKLAPATKRSHATSSFHSAVLHGNLVRLLLLFHLPITIFSTYQMTRPLAMSSAAESGSVAAVSAPSKALAALSFIFLSLLIPAYLAFRVLRTPTPKLYTETRTLLAFGPLYNGYKSGMQKFCLGMFISNIIVGVVIGAAQPNFQPYSPEKALDILAGGGMDITSAAKRAGTAQSITVLTVEVFSALSTSLWLPWATGAGMGLISFLFCVGRVVASVMVVILCGSIDVSPGAAAWVTYGILIILALVYLALVLMLLVKLTEALVRVISGVGFDRSNRVVDTGLLGALGLAGCCGKRRKRSRRKGRGQGTKSPTSQSKHSLSSLAYPSPPAHGRGDTANSNTLLLGSTKSAVSPSTYSNTPPSVLKPEHALRPYKETLDSDAEEDGGAELKNGYIMGAWQPFGTGAGYVAVGSPPPGKKPATGFSKVGGGRAHIDSPYAITGGQGSRSNVSERASSSQHRPELSNGSSRSLARAEQEQPEPQPSYVNGPGVMPVSTSDVEGLPPGAMAPFHVRTKSQTAIIEHPGPFVAPSAGVISGSTNTRPGSRGQAPSSFHPPPSGGKFTTGGTKDDEDSDDDHSSATISAGGGRRRWFGLRKSRPHSADGVASQQQPQDEEFGLKPLDLQGSEGAGSSGGRSFVVVRKPPVSPARSQNFGSAASRGGLGDANAPGTS